MEAVSGSAQAQLQERLESSLEESMTSGDVLTGAVAESEGQRRAFWRLREEQPEGQRLSGEQIKFDISVPPEDVVRFVEEVARLAEQFGGSFAAEHGLGRVKIDLADHCRDRTERDLTKTTMRAIDLMGIMNPGVLIRAK